MGSWARLFFPLFGEIENRHQNSQQPWAAIGAPLAQLAAGLTTSPSVRPALS